jgi:hypothetical protein
MTWVVDQITSFSEGSAFGAFSKRFQGGRETSLSKFLDTVL